jgi:hypothetical protein
MVQSKRKKLNAQRPKSHSAQLTPTPATSLGMPLPAFSSSKNRGQSHDTSPHHDSNGGFLKCVDITIRRDEPLHYGEDKRHMTPIGLVFCMRGEVNRRLHIARAGWRTFFLEMGLEVLGSAVAGRIRAELSCAYRSALLGLGLEAQIAACWLGWRGAPICLLICIVCCWRSS